MRRRSTRNDPHPRQQQTHRAIYAISTKKENQMKSKLLYLLAILVLCGVVAAEYDSAKPLLNASYCAVVGSDHCTMTGPVVGNVDYHFSDVGELTGGIRLLDENGNSIQTGNTTLKGNMILLTTVGGASVAISGLGTGSMAIADNTGNGVTLSAGDLTIQNGGNWIKINSSGIQVLSLPVYANNAAAMAGELIQGNLYRIGTDPDLIAAVH